MTGAGTPLPDQSPSSRDGVEASLASTRVTSANRQEYLIRTRTGDEGKEPTRQIQTTSANRGRADSETTRGTEEGQRPDETPGSPRNTNRTTQPLSHTEEEGEGNVRPAVGANIIETTTNRHESSNPHPHEIRRRATDPAKHKSDRRDTHRNTRASPSRRESPTPYQCRDTD